jgi:hypothetical protein
MRSKRMRGTAATVVKIAALGLLCACSTALAGTAASGSLSMPHVLENGVVIVYTSGARTGTPSCGLTYPDRFAFDSTTAAGKSQWAGILAAFLAGKSVSIAGANSCLVSNGSETLSYFYITD